MKVYRFALTQYCDTSGEGAKIYGGRWNLPGTPAIYAATSISASLLERLTVDPELLSSERFVLYSVMEISVPDRLVFHPSSEELPPNWNQIPASRTSQEYGTSLLKSGILCFAVPSVADPSSGNFLINPLSEHFHLSVSKVYPLQLDQRILRQQ